MRISHQLLIAIIGMTTFINSTKVFAEGVRCEKLFETEGYFLFPDPTEPANSITSLSDPYMNTQETLNFSTRLLNTIDYAARTGKTYLINERQSWNFSDGKKKTWYMDGTIQTSNQTLRISFETIGTGTKVAPNFLSDFFGSPDSYVVNTAVEKWPDIYKNPAFATLMASLRRTLNAVAEKYPESKKVEIEFKNLSSTTLQFLVQLGWTALPKNANGDASVVLEIVR